jgi:uncharacterized damage-inducible protein DinB
MLKITLANLFTRDLTKLKTEIEAYTNESKLWDTELGISNSAGNLCLHLIGNLNGFIGSELGNSGYKRERALEFTLKNIPRAELLEKIDATINTVNKVLSELSEEQLEGEYPILVFKEKTTTEFFLLHLAGHLSYHLGQINYHRRLLDK